MLLLLKRLAFHHEAEVRLIYVEQRIERPVAEGEFVRIPIDPNTMFDEVAFDPRLVLFERREREETALSLKYTGAFRDDGLYQGRSLQIFLSPPVKDDEAAGDHDENPASSSQ
ncbi:MAG TPA: hypothetical protein VGQ49_05545 [Bryobacteraceae bacterium]|nr:hypothetical protein [Bryobacteraceae bacterium]